jgi:hypothetical protein
MHVFPLMVAIVICWNVKTLEVFQGSERNG